MIVPLSFARGGSVVDGIVEFQVVKRKFYYYCIERSFRKRVHNILEGRIVCTLFESFCLRLAETDIQTIHVSFLSLDQSVEIHKSERRTTS